jgi:hypothetical protein
MGSGPRSDDTTYPRLLLTVVTSSRHCHPSTQRRSINQSSPCLHGLLHIKRNATFSPSLLELVARVSLLSVQIIEPLADHIIDLGVLLKMGPVSRGKRL